MGRNESAISEMAKLNAKLNEQYPEPIAGLTNLNEEFPDPLNVSLPADYTTAKWQFEYIRKQIEEFERSLDNEHEVALQLTNFGHTVVLNVTEISYQNPCLIYYYGFINGKRSQLIQHISQISFLLTSVDKEEPQSPRRPIGFFYPEE